MPTSWFRSWSWPASCDICARWPSRPICPACHARHARLQPRCPGCALVLAPGLQRCIRCSETPLQGLSTCVARVNYAYPWTGLLARFKFQQEPGWGRHLARLMQENSAAQELLVSADAVAPIPLSRERLHDRGYNQAWELVKPMRHWPGAPAHAWPDLLLRTAMPLPQHALDREARFTHARTALHTNPVYAEALRGKNIVLVDDVMTTGATLEAAARALLESGATSVSALVFARTPAPIDHRHTPEI